jgi:hypothetical protein
VGPARIARIARTLPHRTHPPTARTLHIFTHISRVVASCTRPRSRTRTARASARCRSAAARRCRGQPRSAAASPPATRAATGPAPRLKISRLRLKIRSAGFASSQLHLKPASPQTNASRLRLKKMPAGTALKTMPAGFASKSAGFASKSGQPASPQASFTSSRLRLKQMPAGFASGGRAPVRRESAHAPPAPPFLPPLGFDHTTPHIGTHKDTRAITALSVHRNRKVDEPLLVPSHQSGGWSASCTHVREPAQRELRPHGAVSERCSLAMSGASPPATRIDSSIWGLH